MNLNGEPRIGRYDAVSASTRNIKRSQLSSLFALSWLAVPGFRPCVGLV